MKSFLLAFLGIVLGAGIGIALAPVLQARGWLWKSAKPAEEPRLKIYANDFGPTTEFFNTFSLEDIAKRARPGKWDGDDRKIGTMLPHPESQAHRRGAAQRCILLQHASQTPLEEADVEKLKTALVAGIHEALTKSGEKFEDRPLLRSKAPVTAGERDRWLFWFVHRIQYSSSEIHGVVQLFGSADDDGLITVSAVVTEQAVRSPFVPKE